MKFLCILLGLVIWCGGCFADSFGRADFRDYLYDEQGNPVFIKIYVRSALTSASKQYIGCASSDGDDEQAILTRMTQEDERGSYIVVPIKKKKSKSKDEEEEEKDEDESTWECPYCGTINDASRHSCKNRKCPLWRFFQ